MWSTVRFSDCETYRYDLNRVWDAAKGSVLFVMLNPSTADERRNDPTVERCERRARSMGYGSLWVVNIFAYRATDPKDLRRAASPIGPLNDDVLTKAAENADCVIAAWGAHGDHHQRGHAVRDMLWARGVSLHHIGLTKMGHPRHPLYVGYDIKPQLWTAT